MAKKDVSAIVSGMGNVLFYWADFYRKIFGIKVDLSGLRIPDAKMDFDRVIIITKGLNLNQVLKACRDRFSVYSYIDDLDKGIPKNDRRADKTYAIRIRDRVEADDEPKNLSANDPKKKGVKGITLLERLILELKYFEETGKHLDTSNITLCSGSRNSDGNIPHVDWNDDKLRVDWCYPHYSDFCLRARAVVS